VEEAVVMTDKQTDKSRGFGFVIFHDQDGFKECLKQKIHEVDGKEVCISSEVVLPNIFLNKQLNQFDLFQLVYPSAM